MSAEQWSERKREVAIAAHEIRLIMAEARCHLDAGYSNVQLLADEDIGISESMDRLMQRVHDLDGDVFAMPPLGHLSDPLPAVGDVIANTRDWGVTSPRTIWADPPFLRVVEVLPIVDYHTWDAANPVYPYADLGHMGHWWVYNGCPEKPTHLADDLPGAAPGGWAIRVESAMYSEQPAWCGPHGPPPPTGRPLNEEDR